MRITGGSHRGRRLAVPPGRDVRPTTDKVRQALFNILTHRGAGADGLAGAVVLDAFCGTGALALEALSRGAAEAVLIDGDRRALDTARSNVAALGEARRATVLRGDATRPPPPRGTPATLVFLDPPYDRGLAGPALAALDRAGWIAADALAAVETRASEGVAPPAGWTAVDDRRWGDTRITLLTRTDDAAPPP